jgi:cytochrome c oxidase assembly factor CtaG/putative copper export protein
VQRIARVSGPAVLLLVAFLALLAALSFGGGANPGIAIDPGAAVRYGVPIAKLVVDLSIAMTLGSLALAIFALSSREKEFHRALDIAAAGAAVWTVSAAASSILVFSSTAYTAPNLSSAFGQSLGDFLTTQVPGRAWLITTLIGATLTVLCFAVRNVTALGFVTVLAMIGLIPLSELGHAGDNAAHNAAITAIWLHVLFASFWLGGLLTLVLLRRVLTPERMAAVLPRYSTIALIAFLIVAASGTVSAVIRIGTLPNLLTPYGVLILVKITALGALGLFGLFYRRAIISRLTASNARRLFWILATAELAFMGVAEGVASALAVSAPPVDAVSASSLGSTTPAEYLTGTPLPPELTPARFLTSFNLDLLWTILCFFALFFYLAGVWRLRRRGDRWPWYRTVLWVAGILVLFWTTNGSLNVYEQFLFSMHMLEHMLLTMAIPVLLVLGAPVTLALRTVAKRDDGSRGAREWILLLVHSRVAGVLTHPLVAAGLFAASLWVFYYSPLFRWATVDHVGHEWMIFHFLIVGYLFVQTLVGVDPIGNQAPYPLRLILLLATMALHAFFGLAMISNTGLFLSDWYGAMGRQWGASPLDDQRAAGGIAWSVGEIPTVSLAIVVALLWSRSDTREAKRRDRAADRDGDADLEAYNAMLAERSGQR